MGMKLKSGADLCGFELSRFCVQNDVAIPDAPASGRKYFHTGTGMEGKYSLLGRERIFTGTSWRAAAYVDDLANLDLATNADYLALKEKVDLLSGEVDTDAIINNMKEVTAFLEGFAEDANLMSVLDGKLDKTGGKARDLAIVGSGTTYLAFESTDGTSYGSIGISSAHAPKFWDGSGAYTLLHSGNVGEYAIRRDLYFTLNDSINMAGYGGTVGGWKANGAAMVLGYDKDYRWAIQAYGTTTGHEIVSRYCLEGTWSAWKTIAFTDSNVASAQALVHSNGTVGATVRNNGIISISEYLILKNSRYCMATLSDGTTERNILGINSDNNLLVGYGSRWDGKTLIYGDGIECIIKDTPVMTINSSGNVTIGGSDLAGTTAALAIYRNNSEPAIALHYSHSRDNNLFGAKIALVDNGYYHGNLVFRVKSAASGSDYASFYTDAMTIVGNNGNVLIGTTDDNGAKLQVNGNAKIEIGNRRYVFADNVFASYDKTIGGFFMYGGIREGEALSCEIAGVDGSWVGQGFKLMQNGNFGIGLTPSAQLHVAKDIVANGTIACKGVAAEGSAPVGTVDKWAGSIATGTKSQTYTHGLGTTDITVAIYEKNGNEWVQILTDVDIVNANSIRVTFGANTTVEHRIVVMG